MSDKMILIQDEFERGDTGEKVPGITMIIDGTLRLVLDKLMSTNSAYGSYTDVVQAALVAGINELITASRS